MDSKITCFANFFISLFDFYFYYHANCVGLYVQNQCNLFYYHANCFCFWQVMSSLNTLQNYAWFLVIGLVLRPCISTTIRVKSNWRVNQVLTFFITWWCVLKYKGFIWSAIKHYMLQEEIKIKLLCALYSYKTQHIYYT